MITVEAAGQLIGLSGIAGVFIFAALYLRAVRGGDRERRYALLAAACCAVNAAGGLLTRDRFEVACATATGAVWLIIWWRDRRKRRAPLSLGAKSRALRDSLVRKARDASRPSPVRRPALDGAA